MKLPELRDGFRMVARCDIDMSLCVETVLMGWREAISYRWMRPVEVDETRSGAYKEKRASEGDGYA